MENDDKTPEDDTEDSPSTVYIVPTSHVSRSSSQEVTETVEAIQPDTVAVELDEARFKRLTSMDMKSNFSVKDVLVADGIPIRGKVLLSILAVLQSSVSKRLGIDVSGIDMLAGIEAAEELEIPVSLVDQDMKETLNRFNQEVSLVELGKMVGYFGIAYLQFWKSSDEDLEEQVEHENMNIDEILDEMGTTFPSFKQVFIDERNEVISTKTVAISREFDEIILVIGAGHEPGVRELLEESPEVVVENIDLL
jgi:pheromone shutdown protein TraB